MSELEVQAGEVPAGRNMNLAGPVPNASFNADDWLRMARQEVVRFQIEASKYVDLELLNALSLDWKVLASDLASGDQVKIVAACQMYASKGEAAIEPLLDVVTTCPDTRARRLALDILRRMVPEKTLEVTFLEGATATEVADHKTHLLEALHDIATSEAGPVIEGFVVHIEPGVRRAAYDLLNRIGPGVFTEAIFQALEDDSDEVKADAIAAVGRFKLLMGVKPLLAFIATTTVLQQEKYERVQPIACQALGEVGDQRALGALLSVLEKKTLPTRTKRAETRAAAAIALVKLVNADTREKIRAALEKQARDSSPLVSSAVKQAMHALKRPNRAGVSDSEDEGDF